MPLYEGKHRIETDYFTVENGRDYSYPLHMHKYFEIVLLTSGEMHVTVDSDKYVLHKGDAVLIFPNQIHSLKTPEYSRYVTCDFIPEMVSRYAETVLGKVPVNNKISLGNSTEFSIFASLDSGDDLFRVKGALYLMCSLFAQEFTFRKPSAKVTNPSLLYKIFDFIENHYKEECSLSDLAKALEYDYSYLSKFFAQSVGISFNDYVRQVRISEACYLLRNGDTSVLEISRDCGFQSLRSFNRNFLEYTGVAPLAYRHLEHNQ